MNPYIDVPGCDSDAFRLTGVSGRGHIICHLLLISPFTNSDEPSRLTPFGKN